VAGEMMSAIDIFRDSEFHPSSTKGTTAIKVGVRPSERRHGEEVERALSPLKELVLLVRLHEEHDARSQRDLLPVEDHDPAASSRRADAPLVAVHRGVAALPMISSCIAVFRAPSSRAMSGFILTL